MKKGFRFALFAVVALLGFGYTNPAAAQDVNKPLLLVAVPDLRGLYAETVLIAVPANRGQHFGFILNRQTTMPLGIAFPTHPPSAKVVEHVFFGGPEMPGTLFALVRRDLEGPALRVLDNVFATGNATVIDEVIEKTPNEARYYFGFVGWQADELKKELAAGFWYAIEASVAELFRKDTISMWQELKERLRNQTPRQEARASP